MATPLAEVSDLEVRLRLEVGSITGADLQAAETALEDASVLVLAQGNPAWTPASVPEIAKSVVIRVALRQYRNPDGFVSEGMGGGAYTYRYADDETSAYLTEAEAVMVQRAFAAEQPSAGRGFVGTVRTPSAYSRSTLTGTPPWWDYAIP
jgi:hypothetical protein